MAKCKALTGSAVKELTMLAFVNTKKAPIFKCVVRK